MSSKLTASFIPRHLTAKENRVHSPTPGNEPVSGFSDRFWDAAWERGSSVPCIRDIRYMARLAHHAPLIAAGYAAVSFVYNEEDKIIIKRIISGRTFRNENDPLCTVLSWTDIQKVHLTGPLNIYAALMTIRLTSI